MSENNNKQAEAQQQPEITLTLTPEEMKQEQVEMLQELQAKQETPVKEKTIEEMYSDAKLSDAERKQVDDFSKTIDITEANSVLNYGSAAQKKITDFSDAALKNVRTKDLGEIGHLLSDLVVELKGYDPNKEEKKGLLGLFKKGSNKVEEFKDTVCEISLSSLIGL